MYNPQKYKSIDVEEAFQFMDYNLFATLISVVDGRPMVSHLPVTPKKSGEQIEIFGHFAKANPHWKVWTGSPATAIFHGPHTYMTPVWYAKNDVPTWNYSAVHVMGTAELIEDHDGIIQCLKDLTGQAERHWPSGWEFFIPEDLAGPVLAKSIVGFKIRVEAINFKKKLSQNRTPADRSGAMKGLSHRKDQQSQLVLQDMRRLYTESGELK